ncbi:MAG: ABC transporter ATP-binding protein [Mariprofundaceae bacterium]|nr:ABC transporter ATP-binding protein [Mariprofundaceae bacterium]
MINVHQLCFDYENKRALDQVSFKLPRQSITALVGANGAGKTTLLRCLSALEAPTSGQIRIDGLNTQEQPRQCHQKIGYLSDFFGLYEELTVQQCLHHRCLLYGIDPIQPRIDETVELTGLSSRLHDRAGHLSRGLRQRLAISQAIIHRPNLLLLDEPASGLDPEARHELSKLFLLLQSQGMTMLVSSHILSELEDYCDHILMIQDGQMAGQRQITQLEQAQLCLQLTTPCQRLDALLSQHENISDIHIDGSQANFSFSGDLQARQQLLQQLIQEGMPLYSFTEQQLKLQDVYSQLRGEQS